MTTTTDETADATIRRLQAVLHDRLAPCLPGHGSYALLDYPDHRNIGDHAIWLGELAYLRKHLRRPPSYVCSRRNLDPSAIRRLSATTPLFLNGGGNFGDIWPPHQHFREDVLAAFPDRVIIQLPQSIHFSSPEALTRAQRVISKHPGFALFVRDEGSLSFARSHFDCPVSLCPDMAFALGQQRRPRPPRRDVLMMLRRDKESVDDGAGMDGMPASFGPAEDWVTFDEQRRGNKAPLRHRVEAKLLRSAPFISEAHRRHRAYRDRSAWMVRRGLEQLAKARCIVTDRLHVHILSLILDIPHVCLDNNYGKVSRFRQCWTASYRDSRQAASFAEATKQAMQLLETGQPAR